MASVRAVFTGGDTAGTVDRFATFTPAVGDLLVIFCDVRANANTTPTCSDDQGGTYTRVDVAEFGTNQHTLSCFVADQLVSSAVSTTVTVATGSNTSGNVVAVALDGFTNVGSAAVVQSAKDENNAAAATPAVTFGAAVDTANVTLGAVGNTNNPAGMTAPAGWTEQADIGQPTSNVGLQVVSRDSGFTGTTITWGSASSVVSAALAVELVPGGGGGPATYTLPIGHVASPASVRGLLVPATTPVAVAHVPSAAAVRGLVLSIPSSVFYSTDFETGTVADTFDVAQGSTVSIATDQAHGGTHALKVVQTGSVSGSTRTLPASTRTLVMRFWLRLDVNPSTASQTIFNVNIGGVSGLVVRVTTGGVIQVGFNGGTFQNGGTLALDTWHSIDLAIDTSAAAFTCDWQVDNAAKTQATKAGTAADMDTLKFANAGTNTITFWIDDLQLASSLADYPLTDGGAGGPVTYTLTIGHVSSPAAVRGLLAPITGSLPVGHVSSPAAVHGLLVPADAGLSIGHVPSPAFVRGLSTPASGGLAIAWVPPPGRETAVCALGMTNQSLGTVSISATEELLGRRFVGLRQNQSITVTSVSVASADYDLGYTVQYRNQETDNAGDWALTAAGGFDADVDSFVSNIIAAGHWSPARPFYLGYHHEQTVDNGTQTGYPTNGTQQDYIDGYREWALHLDAIGASTWSVDGDWIGGPIQRVWCPWAMMFHSSAPAGKTADDFDPNLGTSPAPAGRSYFDFVALDYYNPVISAGTLKYTTDPATVLDAVVAKCEAYGKDFLIPEFGCDLSGFTDQASKDAKAAWVTNVKDYLKARGSAGPGVCRALWLTFSDGGGDYRVDDTAESLAAYQALAQDAYFGAALGPTVFGLNLGGGHVYTLLIGHVPSPATIHGLRLPLTGSLPVGHVPSPAAVHGLLVPVHGDLSLAHVPSPAAVHGVALTTLIRATLAYLVGCYTGSAMTPLFPTQLAVQLSDFAVDVLLADGGYTVQLGDLHFEVEL